MAISRVDDLDGTAPAREYSFALDGVTYAIDLSEENVAALKETMHRYIAAARPLGRKARAATTTTGRNRTDLAEVRAWARENGMEVNERGRISKEILDAFDAARSAA